jgi:surfeit locus 1 family protein
MTLRLPAPALVALLVAVTALLIGLGIWQLERNAWKQDLVAERNARTDAAPLTFEEANALDLDALDYHRLAATGDWDTEHTFILANRARYGTKGEELVVPLLVAPGGPAVLVDRGWYPDGRRDAAETALAERPDAVEGLISVHTSSGHETDAGTWTNLDPGAMAAELPYDVLPWIVIEGERVDPGANPDGELPVQRYTGFVNTIPHMEYALTWFGLAAGLIVIAALRFGPLRRQGGRTAPAGHAEAPEGSTPGRQKRSEAVEEAKPTP